MAYLFDTNICIYIIRQKPLTVLERFKTITPGQAGISAITVAELEFGARKSSQPQKNLSALQQFLIPFNLFDFDYAASVEYGIVRSELELKGTPIGRASCFDGNYLCHGETLFLSLTKTKMMENNNDHPGIYIPPPLFYVAIFFAAVLMQRLLPLSRNFFYTTTSKIIGSVVILIGLLFNLPALRQFFKTKNTLVTIKPANSLQTTGIYSVSRNPMYLSLLLFYIGLSFIIGNWWNLILLPFLILIVQEYVIKREEKYLDRRFGQQYFDYKAKVRRWL